MYSSLRNLRLWHPIMTLGCVLDGLGCPLVWVWNMASLNGSLCVFRHYSTESMAALSPASTSRGKKMALVSPNLLFMICKITFIQVK